MVQDSGGVPLCAKGVVVSINHKSMDVVWDIPFMSGTTLGDRYVRPSALTGLQLTPLFQDVHNTADLAPRLIPALI
jgi:hypothetical protein